MLIYIQGPEQILSYSLRIHKLLEKIERHGSLKQAAADLGMSYRAAWGKMHATEKALGEKIIQRSGHRRDGHELTDFGRQLKDNFNQWFDEVERYAMQSAGQLFPWSLKRFPESQHRVQGSP